MSVIGGDIFQLLCLDLGELAVAFLHPCACEPLAKTRVLTARSGGDVAVVVQFFVLSQLF